MREYNFMDELCEFSAVLYLSVSALMIGYDAHPARWFLDICLIPFILSLIFSVLRYLGAMK